MIKGRVQEYGRYETMYMYDYNKKNNKETFEEFLQEPEKSSQDHSIDDPGIYL